MGSRVFSRSLRVGSADPEVVGEFAGLAQPPEAVDQAGSVMSRRAADLVDDEFFPAAAAGRRQVRALMHQLVVRVQRRSTWVRVLHSQIRTPRCSPIKAVGESVLAETNVGVLSAQDPPRMPTQFGSHGGDSMGGHRQEKPSLTRTYMRI